MPVTVTTHVIAVGDAGVLHTLRVMQGLVDQAMDSPIVIQAARSLATADGAQQSPADQYRTALRIRAFLYRYWRYVDDPTTREHLEDATYLLTQFQANRYFAGDCDEAAILAATLGKAVNLGATFTVLAFDTGPGDPANNARYAHVYTTLLTAGGQWVNIDITRPSGPVAPVVRSLVVDA